MPEIKSQYREFAHEPPETIIGWRAGRNEAKQIQIELVISRGYRTNETVLGAVRSSVWNSFEEGDIDLQVRYHAETPFAQHKMYDNLPEAKTYVWEQARQFYQLVTPMLAGPVKDTGLIDMATEGPVVQEFKTEIVTLDGLPSDTRRKFTGKAMSPFDTGWRGVVLNSLYSYNGLGDVCFATVEIEFKEE